MTATSALARRVLEEYAGAGGTDPARLQRIEEALAPGLPTARDENWKYASLRGIERSRFRPPEALDAAALAAARDLLPAPLPGLARVVFVDGLHAPGLGSGALPHGATVVPATALPYSADQPPAPEPADRVASGAALLPAPSSVPAADLRFARINQAMAVDAMCIAVPDGEELAIEVVFVALSPATRHASHPVLRAAAGAGARLQLVERHLGGAEGSFSNARISVEVGRSARVAHTRLQQLGPRAQHVETIEWALRAAAEASLVSIATGAAASRSTALVRHAGRDATLRWHAAALAGGGQSSDSFVRVDHAAPGARTEQMFRGIAAGRGRVAFNGHMVVHGSAPGSDTAQSLKCLNDGPEAESDVRPQLEIHTDAVRATHGATVGKLDETMRFYLLSRGLEPATAAALLKWAFIEDVVARIELPALRDGTERSLAAALGDPVVAESLS